MKKFIIGILTTLAVSHTFKRELLLIVYKEYVKVNEEFNVLPEVSLEALQRTNKKMQENKERLANTLFVDYKFNFRELFSSFYKKQLTDLLEEGKNETPPTEVSVVKDPIAKAALNFVNQVSPHNKITDEQVIATQKQLRERGML